MASLKSIFGSMFQSAPAPAEAELDRLDASLARRDEIEQLVGQGHMIPANKMYREDTGVSLRAAKAAVDRMQRNRR